MTRIEFTVRRQGRSWYVDVGQDTHGPYLSRTDALADAIDAADGAGKKRAHAVVLVKDSPRDAAVVWTYGKDTVHKSFAVQDPT